MKTYTNLWQEIISFKNLLLAYNKAKKAKPHTNETLSFSLNLEKNLIDLQEELLNGSYNQSNYRVFIIFDPKKRTIKYLIKERFEQYIIFTCQKREEEVIRNNSISHKYIKL